MNSIFITVKRKIQNISRAKIIKNTIINVN